MKKNIWFFERKARLHQQLARYPCIRKTANAARNIASSAALALAGAFVLSMLVPSAFADDPGAATLNTVLTTLTTYVKLAGGVLCVWGAVVLGSGLNDHNGPGIQQGIWRIVGGGVIIAAAALFSSLS